MSTYDVVVVGGGVVGATAALALAKKTALQIALIDSRKISADWDKEKLTCRVSAISLASQRIFQRLGVWESIREKRISPYQKMHVWDEGGNGKLDFDCAALQSQALGFIVEDDVIRASLQESLAGQSNVHLLSPVKLHSMKEKSDCIELVGDANTVLQAKLVIAADGGNSWVREQAGIVTKNADYQHDAIVATVQTSLSHQMTAWQRFLTTGPLAFLPLQDAYTSSIVWSTSPEEASRLLSLDDVSFCDVLSVAFAHRLGEVTLAGQRQRFHLQMRHAKNYVKSRLALIGDAAHTIHPLAGQGVNLGLLDVACLVEVLVDAIAKKRDYTSFAALRRYERWRKAENSAMLVFVEAIKQLFSSQMKPVQQMRNLGLNMTNQMTFVKNFFTNYAAGNRMDMPMLAI